MKKDLSLGISLLNAAAILNYWTLNNRAREARAAAKII